MTDMLTRPEVLIAAVVVVGVLGGALYYTNPGRQFAARWRKPGPAGATRGGTAQTAGRGGAVPGVSTESVGDLVTPDHPVVTFADVGGLDVALDELREITEFLSDPERFQGLGAQLPKGVLLYGLPGCGKTLLARALAGETGVPFYFVSAASFVEQFVGVGAARVRQLFEGAKQNAPAIVFIDELDAIGRCRNAEQGGGREFDHTLNQLLVELDGFQGSSGVLILAATNRPELIDPALLRPGRFDRRIHIDRPDRGGREEILRLHASHRPVSSRVDWAEVASDTAGLTAAELAYIVNEASLLAARRHHEKVSPEDVEEAAARILAGTRSSRVMDDEEKQLVAVHEAGHAVLSLLLRGMKTPARVSIVTRTGAFGRSTWAAEDDNAISTKRALMAQLIVLLGGRAAEMNTFGEPSTRAEDDLEQAADLASRMVERLAMTGRFELARSGGAESSHGDQDQGGKEVRGLLSRAEQAARTILGDNAAKLRVVADTLSERETLTAADIEQLIGRPGRQATVHALSPATQATAN